MTTWCDNTPRTASWKPQPMASSGTLKSAQVRVLPLCNSSDLIVGDLAGADDDVVRHPAAHRLVEAAADGLVRHLEVGPGARVALVQLLRSDSWRSCRRG